MRQPNNKKGPEGMAKVNKDVVKRLMSYIGHYKLRFAAVLICIVVNALAMVSCSLYLQTLIDSYITPLLQAATPGGNGHSGIISVVITSQHRLYALRNQRVTRQ